MRLNEQQQNTIRACAEQAFGTGVVVRLFGSRTDDAKRGGDIDLLVETTVADPQSVQSACTRFLAGLYAQLGEQKIDVLVDYPGRQSRPPIYDIARTTGVVL
ncbi:MAG: nucleotidyltransferase domain-containing protein [Rhodoferax sp.]